METRKKRVEAIKNGIKYSSAAAGTTASTLECIGLFVGIPGFIKWTIVALIGLIAGCFGYCMTANDIEDKEQKRTATEHEQQVTLEERHQLVEMTREMLFDMAEMKEDLEYHHHHPRGADEKVHGDTYLLRAQSKVDKWRELTKDLKHERDAKASTSGLFSLHTIAAKKAVNDVKFKDAKKPVVFHMRQDDDELSVAGLRLALH